MSTNQFPPSVGKRGQETFYSTVNVLTKGKIEMFEGCTSAEFNSIEYALRSRYGEKDYVFQLVGRDAFRSMPSAVEQAKVLIRRKLASVKKQEKKLLDVLKQWGDQASYEEVEDDDEEAAKVHIRNLFAEWATEMGER